MKINEMLNSRFLKQTDIDGDTTVTIQAVKKDNIARDDQPEDIKPVCKFREYEKPMILNTTNTKRLFAFLGKESDDWIGKKVVLYRDEEVEYSGQITGGLRIRALKTKPTKQAPDETPFMNDDLGGIPQ